MGIFTYLNKASLFSLYIVYMANPMHTINIVMIISLFLILWYFITSSPLCENFGYSGANWWGWNNLGWFPWNQPTRFPKLFYDIRGDPNLVYRRHIFGGLIPYGYVFGPYVYDAQGNLIHDANKPYYIA